MHGRLKVKSSAQLEAEQQARKEEKLKKFQKYMGKIFELRAKFHNLPQALETHALSESTGVNNDENAEDSGEEVDQEQEEILIPLLTATREILYSNSDIGTLWNIRREVVLRLIEKCTGYAKFDIHCKKMPK